MSFALLFWYITPHLGYYINNEYATEEMKENPPDVPQIEQVLIFIFFEILSRINRIKKKPIQFYKYIQS